MLTYTNHTIHSQHRECLCISDPKRKQGLTPISTIIQVKREIEEGDLKQ